MSLQGAFSIFSLAIVTLQNHVAEIESIQQSIKPMQLHSCVALCVTERWFKQGLL